MPFSRDTIILQQSLDRLLASKCPFALYRLPNKRDFTLVLQDSQEETTLLSLDDLDHTKPAFVFAPFAINKEHPVVLIKQDHVFTDLVQMAQGIAELNRRAHTDEEDNIPYIRGSFTLPEENDDEDFDPENQQRYTKAFYTFMEALGNDDFSKLVLSRCAHQELPRHFSLAEAFAQAAVLYPSMFISLVYTKTTGLWLGSTPETLVQLSENNTKGFTMALAGTMPLESASSPLPELSEWSEKNRHEQQIVTNYIQEVLDKHSSSVEASGPQSSAAGLLTHLCTRFNFKCTSPLGALLKDLHPTPAVCGLPKREAYDFILEHEGYDRSYYSGFLGPMNAESSSLFVNLRCMQIDLEKQEATLYAGGGLLPQSTATSEFAETQFKMNTMLNIF